MVSGIEFNRGVDDIYMLVPLRKEHNGLRVEAQSVTETFEFPMNTLEELRAADTNHDYILSLNELRNFKEKTAFSQSILEMMEKFADTHKI